MGFDAYRFLTDFNIPIGDGQYQSRDWFNVSCPFCGDRSYHLGIHKTQGACSCFKCGSHGLFDTVTALTGLPASSIVRDYATITSFTRIERAEYELKSHQLIVPGDKNFKEHHKNYLRKRGFDPEYVIQKYDLRVTNSIGRHGNRIIIPIYYKNRIVSYQGRTFIGAEPKYLTCHPDEELLLHKKIFYNLQNSTGRSVILVEGVMDVMKLGDNSIASFGTSLTSAQVNFLIDNYTQVYILFDPEPVAQEKATKLAYQLSSSGVKSEVITLDSGDPGDLTEDEALQVKATLHLL